MSFDLVVSNFDEAWTRVNKKFLGADGERPEDATRALMCYSFDNLIVVKGKPRITLDPGLLVNYSYNKWPHLLRTYMDWEQFDWLVERTRFRLARSGDHSVPLGYSFKPSPKMNGSCLIGFTFLVDKDRREINFNMNTRVAEVTRRMLMDFILIYKICRKLFYGTEVWDYEWTMNFYYQMAYQSAMFVPILHTTFDFEEMGISTTGKKHKGFIGRVERELEVCLKKVSKGSGFAQMKKIRDLVAADMRGVERKSLPVKKFKLVRGGK